MTPSSAATTRMTNGDLGAPGAHHGERLVSRGVEHRDAAVHCLDGICADMLRDAAEFAGRDVRAADGVEQFGLSMVDMTHDRNDRGTRQEARYRRRPRSR
jgi:hypothetical protein